MLWTYYFSKIKNKQFLFITKNGFNLEIFFQFKIFHMEANGPLNRLFLKVIKFVIWFTILLKQIWFKSFSEFQLTQLIKHFVVVE